MTLETEARKAYLMRGWNLEKRVKAREDQVDVLRDRMQRVRSAAPKGLAGDRKGPQTDWTEVVDALVDAESEYLKEIAELYRIQGEIRKVLAKVEPEHYRTLLQYRYLLCLGWDEIADRMCYDPRYIYKLHDKALRALEEVMNGEG